MRAGGIRGDPGGSRCSQQQERHKPRVTREQLLCKHSQGLWNIPGGASPCTAAEFGVSPVPVAVPNWGQSHTGEGAWTRPWGWKHKVLQREAKWDGTGWSLRRRPHVHGSPESGDRLAVDEFDNARAILTNPLIWPLCKHKEGRAWPRLSKPSAIPGSGLCQDCPSTVTSWGHPGRQDQAGLFVSHTEPALKFPAHIAPRSREGREEERNSCSSKTLPVQTRGWQRSRWSHWRQFIVTIVTAQHRGHSPLPALPPKETRTSCLGRD